MDFHLSKLLLKKSVKAGIVKVGGKTNEVGREISALLGVNTMQSRFRLDVYPSVGHTHQVSV